MPSWKKVIISGSNAALNSLTVTNGITGSLFGTASYATVAANGGVTQLLAGPNITLSPTNGLGQVTISSLSGSGGGGFNTATGSYGSFYDTTTQTNPVGNIPRSMSLDTTDITNGVSISGSTNPYNTYIKTQNAGVYDIQFSAQLDKTDSGADEIVIWLRKNGTDLTDTATTITLSGNNDKQVAAWNWFVNSAANDYYQIIWQSADTDLRLLAEPADGHPGIPSVIVTANRVDQFLSNTGSFSGSFTGQFTGSLLGTASFATSASFASTASFLGSTTNAFIQNGNSFGATALLGTNDNQSLALETNGTTRMFISSSGNVGIGTTSPSSPLHIVKSGGARINLGDSQNTVAISSIEEVGDSAIGLYTQTSIERMRISSAGNVGIGTSNPLAKLHVVGSLRNSFASGSGGDVYMNIIDGVSNGFRTVVTTSNQIDYTFHNGSNQEVLSILNSGNVGIGTTSPSAKLDVTDTSAGNIVNNITVQNASNTAGTEAGVFFAPTTATGNIRGARITGIQEDGNNTIGLKFYTALGAPPTEKMRITSAGNVGINTTAPETKLQIEDVTKVLTNNVAGVAQGTLSLVSTDAQAADIGASLLFGGNYIDSNSTRIAYAAITGRKSNGTTGNADGYLSFLTWRTTGLTEAMRITSAGNVGIGTTSPSYPLHVSASVSGTSIYATGDIVAFSDQSVKENIRPIENVLERIGDSRGVLYDRVDNGEKDNIGFIAQELEVAFPELVVTNPDGTKAVKYQNAVAVLFEAIKEQQKQIDSILKLLDK